MLLSYFVLLFLDSFYLVMERVQFGVPLPLNSVSALVVIKQTKKSVSVLALEMSLSQKTQNFTLRFQEKKKIRIRTKAFCTWEGLDGRLV